MDYPGICYYTNNPQFSSVQSLSLIRLFAIPWTAAGQSPCPSKTSGVYPNSCSLSWWYLILCCPFLLSSIFPSIRVFSNESVLHFSCQSIEASASTSVHPVNIQDWLPLGWTDWISLQSKELSRIFSNTKVQKHQFFGTQFLYSLILTPIHDTGKTIS